MRLWPVSCLIFTMTFVLLAQTIDLTGKVTDNTGKPIQNAVVVLVEKEMTDTTGNDGTYSIFKGNTTAASVFSIPQSEAITIQHGVIKLSIPQAASMKIEVFDIQGNVLDRVNRSHATAGIYFFDILKKTKTSQMMVIRASIGRRVSNFRYIPLQQSLYFVSRKTLAVSSDHEALAKQLADVDSLKVAAQGYESKVVTIASYQETNNIMLDEVSNLDPFSFFVTSWETIQELAGEDGFGGDLRFGETGPGAGLRGADKICETIAEMSMPGSKVKQWRAFLSVSADENGNQVDARDRIGEGPWYDRLGRLLAPTLDDLINERPQNGDATIQNDLPNEFGIPNHRPDADGEDVDNHHIITGSDAEGRLYNSSGKTYTCQDWTSVSESLQAKCGFAWPRRMSFRKTAWGGGGGVSSGSNWITGYTSNGCAAGEWLKDDGPGRGSGPIIGSGGGYGGWYCFALKP